MDGTFQQALQALFAPDPHAQQQANAWLTSFAATPDAWASAASLLGAGYPQEVSFFCANMLLSKVRQEWSHLPPEQRQQLNTMVRGKLQELWSAPNRALVAKRLAQALAAMAALSGPDAAVQFVAEALHMAAGQTAPLHSTLQLLTCLAEEGDRLEWVKRKGLVAALMPQVPQVVVLLQGLLLSLAGPSPAAGLSGSDVLLCLHAWLKLDPAGAGGLCLAPGEIRAAAPQLLPLLLRSLGGAVPGAAGGGGAGAAGAGGGDDGKLSTFGELAADLLGPGKVSADDILALKEATDILLSHRPTLVLAASPQATPQALAVAREVAWVVTAIAERDATFVSGGGAGNGGGGGGGSGSAGGSAAGTGVGGEGAGRALALAELMLMCLASSNRSTADAALDYFSAINTVPVAERHPQLCAPLFLGALPHLLRHAQYPASFTTWDEEEQDEDEFYRFRDQQLADVLESAYNMTRCEYLRAVQSLAAGATAWQQYEVALYGLRAVHLMVKNRVLGKAALGSDVAQEGAEAGATLLAMFGELCSGAGNAGRFLPQPMVARAACRLLGDYAQWFGRSETGAPVEGAVSLLLHCLPLPSAQQPAAHAMRNMCVRCSSRLSDPAVLLRLMDSAAAAVAPVPAAGAAAAAVPLGPEERAAVVEGLARLASALPSPTNGEAGLRLIQPLLQRAQSLAQTGALSGPNLQVLASDLHLIASAVRFLDTSAHEAAAAAAGAGAPHPALKVLEGAWPILSGVAQSPVCQQDSTVVEALCEVYQRSLLSAKMAARPLLPTLIASVLGIFKAAPHPAVCDVLGTVVEIFGELKSAPEVGDMQRTAFAEVCSVALQRLQGQVSDIEAHAELYRGVYSMTDRYLVFARDVLLGCAVLPQLLACSTVLLRLRDREALAQVLALLTHLAALPAKLASGAAADAHQQQHHASLVALLQAHGPAITTALLTALLDTCPRQLLRPLSGCLYSLLTAPSLAPSAGGWLNQALQSQPPGSPAMAKLGAEGCQRFLAIALRQPCLPRGRFDALMTDMAGIANGEETTDALLGYEM